MATLRNPHPGIILKEEFIDDLGLTQNALAKAIRFPKTVLARLFAGFAGLLRLLISAFAGILDFLRVSGCAFRTPMT